MNSTVNQLLLIDDSDATNNFHNRLLGKLNFANTINICSNGKEGLASIAAATSIPDLIFLDLNMPVMDGFEFLANVTVLFKEKTQQKPPIVVLTSSEESVDKMKCKELYANTFFFSKPLTIDQINEITEAIR